MSRANGRAVEFVEPEGVAVVDIEPPEPDPNEVVVETTRSAISAGTERLIYRGNVDGDSVADETLPSLSGTLSYPVRYGYAAVGHVTEIGRRVDPEWRGRPVFAFNPHESYALADPEDLHPIPDGIGFERAALFANAETAVNFALDAAPRLGERIAVFGQGVVGLLTTAMLAETAAETLIAVEPHDSRRGLATRLGADETVDPKARDAATAIRELTGGDGVDTAIEVSGCPSTLETAVEATRYDGRVVVGSWYGTKRAAIEFGDHYHRGRISIESSQVSTISPELRGRWSKRRRRETAWRQLRGIDAEEFITHRFHVSDAEKAYRQLTDRPEETLQILFTY